MKGFSIPVLDKVTVKQLRDGVSQNSILDILRRSYDVAKKPQAKYVERTHASTNVNLIIDELLRRESEK